MFEIDNRIIQNGFYSEREYIRKRMITACDQKFDDGIQLCAKEMQQCTDVETALNREGRCVLIPNMTAVQFREIIECARGDYIRLHHLENGTEGNGEDMVTPFDHLLY